MENNSDPPQPEPITLRCFDLQRDIGPFRHWVADPDSIRFSSPNHHFQFKDQLDYHIHRYILKQTWFRIICRPADTAVGFIFFKQDNTGFCKVKFNVAPEHRRQGIATAAVTMAIAERFAAISTLDWVEAKVDLNNHAAKKVLRKVGFHEVMTVWGFCRVKKEQRCMVLFKFFRCYYAI